MVELRSKVADLMYYSLTESLINSLTDNKLNQTGDEMMFLLNTAESTPLGFINKTNELASVLFTDIDIRKTNMDLFVTNYFKNYFSEEDIAGLSGLNLEIESLSVDVLDILNSSIKNNKKLTENFNESNKEEVENIIKVSKDELVLRLKDIIDIVKEFKDEYLDKSKFVHNLNKEEKISYNEIKLRVNKIYSELDDIQKELNKRDIKYLSDNANRFEIANLFTRLNICIALCVVMMINTRILFGDNREEVSAKANIPLKDLAKVNNVNHVPFEILKNLNLLFNDKNTYNSYFIDYLVKNINPKYIESLKFFYGNHPSENVQGEDLSVFIMKRASISFKYLHHIDNIIRSSKDLLDSFNSLYVSFKLKPLTQVMNGAEITAIKDKINVCINSSNSFKNDIKTYVYGGAETLKQEMTRRIANNDHNAHVLWDIETNNQVEDNSIYGSNQE